MDRAAHLAAAVQVHLSRALSRLALDRAARIAAQIDRLERKAELLNAEGRAWLAEAERLAQDAEDRAAAIARDDGETVTILT